MSGAVIYTVLRLSLLRYLSSKFRAVVQNEGVQVLGILLIWSTFGRQGGFEGASL